MKNYNQTSVHPHIILNLHRLPGRLDVEQTAALLGFQLYEIPLLVRAKLLHPLGKPSQNSRKFFAACDVQERMQNRQWLDTATKVVPKLIQQANGKTPGTYWPKQNDSNPVS